MFRTSLLDTILSSFSFHFGSTYEPKRPPNELKSSNFIDIWLKVLPLGSKMSILAPKGVPKDPIWTSWVPKVTSEAPRGPYFEGLGPPKCVQEAHLDAQGGHFEGLGLPKYPQELHLVVAAYFSDSFFCVTRSVTLYCGLLRFVAVFRDSFHGALTYLFTLSLYSYAITCPRPPVTHTYTYASSAFCVATRPNCI